MLLNGSSFKMYNNAVALDLSKQNIVKFMVYIAVVDPEIIRTILSN